MNELMYSFRNNNVRVVMKGNGPWFVAKDVCEVLELNNVSQATSRLSDKRKGIITNDGAFGLHELIIVDESGLYELIFTSRKEQAIAFKEWVFEEVLPSIRKNGAYMTPVTLEKTISDPDFLIGLLNNLKAEQDKSRLLEEEAVNNSPKVLFADAVGQSDNTISVGELSKLIAQNGYPIGQNRLYEWMRENGYLIKREGIDKNTPKQQYIEQGLLRIKEGVSVTSNGSKTYKTTRVTGKGQSYFINKFLGVK